MPRSTKSLTVSLLFLSGLVQGCTSFRPVHIQRLAEQIDVGDTIHVTTKDDEEFRLKVVTLDKDRISGTTVPGEAPVAIALADITGIKVQKFNDGKSVEAGIGVAAVALTVLAVAAGTSLMKFLMHPLRRAP